MSHHPPVRGNFVPKFRSSLRSGSIECESGGISEGSSGLKRVGPSLCEDSHMVLSSRKGRAFQYLERSVLLWRDHHWCDRHSEVPNVLTRTVCVVLQVGS